MVNLFIVAFALFNTLVLVKYLWDAKKEKLRALVPLVLSFVVSAAIIFLLNEPANETTAYLILDFAVLFSIIPFYYARRTRWLLLTVIIIAAEFFYATYVFGSLLYPFIQMFAIGTTFGMIHRKGLAGLNVPHIAGTKRVETRRDFVHIGIGIVLLAIFLILPFYYAVYITIIVIFLGYIYNSALVSRFSKSRHYSILSSFERNVEIFGLGALYLAVGTAFLLGFIHNLHFVIIGIAALLLADPIATIVGMNVGGAKLFYNKKKSVLGTLAFFLVVTLVGYPFIGAYSVLFGAVLALVESVKIPFDDNLTIPIAMIIIYVIFLMTVGQLPFSSIL